MLVIRCEENVKKAEEKLQKAQEELEAKKKQLEDAKKELDEYFAGRRRYFDVPLRMFGTEFRRRVWQAIGEVPYGDTISYGELAERVGDSRAVRAVAAAVGANPVSIFVPCHRIVGRDGALVGYAGGVEAKRRLLELEGADVRRQGRPAAEGIYAATMK